MMRRLASLAVLGLVMCGVAIARAEDPEQKEAKESAARAERQAEDQAAQAADAEALPAVFGPHGAAPVEPKPPPVQSAEPYTPWIEQEIDAFDTDVIPGLDLRLYWKRGVNYKVKDDLEIFDKPAGLDGRIGLRFQGDAAAFAPDGVKGANSGLGVRRFFFYTTGELDLLYPVLFALDLGVDQGRFFVDDAYLWFTDLPYVGTFKLGQFTAPMSLSHLTSSATRPFMEIATPAEAFSPGSKAGLQIANTAYERHLTWQLGWFADSQAVPVGDASDSVSRVVGRLTGLPLYEARDGRQELLHLGISGSYVFSGDQRVRYRSRPESFLAPEMVDTGDIPASNALLFGLEGAWVDGPLSVQSEFLASSVRSTDVGEPFFYGLYVEGSWFLTGETRPYNRTSAVFGPVVPKHPLYWGDPQWGAWELAGRLSWTDVTAADVRGGEVFTLMTGLNWYWSRYGRFLFEYGYSAAGAGGPQSGGIHIFQARIQLNI